MRQRKKLALRMGLAMAAVVTPVVALTVPGPLAGAGPIIIADQYNWPSGDTPETFQGPVPRAECGPGSKPEVGMQGQVPIEARESGESAEIHNCNMDVVGHYSPDDPQGFEGAEWQFARYKDCAYYSQRLAAVGKPATQDIPDNIADPPKLISQAVQERPGTVVLDMSNPADPKFATNLTTLGMLDPWETLKVHKERGLLAAVNVKDGEGTGFLDIYDISQDCANPKHLSTTITSAVNHEGNFSNDGMTYYSGGLTPGITSAIDVSDPRNPRTLDVFFSKLGQHGMTTSQDGNRLYLSHINEDWAYTLPTSGNGSTPSLTGGNGLGIYDISDIQERKPNPKVTLVSALQWDDGQIGQHTLNVFKDGKPYLIHVDEAGHGAARIVDISDEKNPWVVSKLKTEIMMPENRDLATSEIRRYTKGEFGGLLFFGYNFHYCNVDEVQDPSMLACSAFNQGLRVFDIRNLANPKEIAYFKPGGDGTLQPGSFGGTTGSYPAAMPQFVPSRQEIWFSDQDRGVFVTKLTNGAWIGDATEETTSQGN